MSEMKELSVQEDTAVSLKAMSHSLRKQATALMELAKKIEAGFEESGLAQAGKVAGFQARELEGLATHLRTVESYLEGNASA